MGEKQALEDDAASCQRRMSAATQLIEGLSGEKVRWTMQSQQFQSQINRLVGDVLLATGFLSYTGPFNQEFRNLLIKERWITEMDERPGFKLSFHNYFFTYLQFLNLIQTNSLH